MKSDDIIKNNDPYTGPSFSLRNRIKRFCWNICYWLLFRFTPRYFHWWRNSVLRIFGARLGKGVHVYPKVKIWAPWNLIIEDYGGLGDDVNCYSMGKIHIGKRVVVSQGVHLCAGTHDYESSNFQLVTHPIIIKNEAWLCTECFIGSGVTVGEGSVIGARAVVTQNMPDWMVCGGNPCKPIKPRTIKKR